MSETFYDHDEEVLLLKNLSKQDFLHVGLDQIAYIKPVADDVDALGCYSVHAADGSQLSVMDSYDTALAAIKMNDLFAVTLH